MTGDAARCALQLGRHRRRGRRDGILVTVRRGKTNQEGETKDVRFVKAAVTGAIRTLQGRGAGGRRRAAACRSLLAGNWRTITSESIRRETARAPGRGRVHRRAHRQRQDRPADGTRRRPRIDNADRPHADLRSEPSCGWSSIWTVGGGSCAGPIPNAIERLQASL